MIFGGSCRVAVWLCISMVIEISLSQSDSLITSIGSAEATGSASATKAAQTHTISVGKLENKYSPDVVQAAVNDVIEFQFFPANHSVARAEYEYPCVPYELTGANKVGFFSGFHPVDAILDSPPTWSMTVNDTDPIFFYCSAPGSCINYAMVGVINPNNSVSLEKQKDDALDSTYMVVPGEKLPTEETLPSQTAISTNPATVTLTPSSSSSPTTASAQSSTPPSTHHHLSSGAIAGIAVGGVVAAAAIGILLFLLGKHRTELQFLRRGGHAQQSQQRPAYPEMGPSYSSMGPINPAFPHHSEDPRFNEPQKYTYDVPPYHSEGRSVPSELPSPPLGPSISRSGSPSSELDTRRNTMNPSLMENAGLGVLPPNGSHGQRY